MAAQASNMELIERVKAHPEIWQHSHPLSKNKTVRYKFWHRLAKELKSDEQQLRKNWKYLADQYRREYKKIKAQEDAVGVAVDSGWAYYEALSFLKGGLASTAKPRPPPLSSDSDNNDSAQEPAPSTFTSFPNENDDIYNQENAAWPFPSPAKKPKKGPSPSKADLILRELQVLKSTISQSPETLKDDDDYMFFMSVLPMVRTLPVLKKLQLRGKINEWILESLSEREADPLNSASQYATVDQLDQEDSKQNVRNQIMAAEDDDC